MDAKTNRLEKKPYEKPRVSSGEAFEIEAACSLFIACSVSES